MQDPFDDVAEIFSEVFEGMVEFKRSLKRSDIMGALLIGTLFFIIYLLIILAK